MGNVNQYFKKINCITAVSIAGSNYLATLMNFRIILLIYIVSVLSDSRTGDFYGCAIRACRTFHWTLL